MLEINLIYGENLLKRGFSDFHPNTLIKFRQLVNKALKMDAFIKNSFF